jgi:lactoylglutathione lyase
MKLLRKRDVPEEKYTNAFLGFGPEDTNFALELTYSMFTAHSLFFPLAQQI